MNTAVDNANDEPPDARDAKSEREALKLPAAKAACGAQSSSP
jgi:hypothetical protein